MRKKVGENLNKTCTIILECDLLCIIYLFRCCFGRETRFLCAIVRSTLKQIEKKGKNSHCGALKS